uniref:NADH dehydrogenase I subunit N n=1 Tax=uncultured prokaryote TaxID=198431 RepID=H5SP90_9ZZZZ|nr:NADH dehydrogenase I subunit N [uncultured prokaryote]
MENILSIRWFFPEIIISSFILLILLMVSFSRKTDIVAHYVSLFGLFLSFLAVMYGIKDQQVSIFRDLLAIDKLSTYFKVFFIIVTALTILISMGSLEVERLKKSEYYSLILAVCLGMMLLSSATDLLMIYLSMEMVSLTSYILVGFLREENRSTEAALKYVLFGAACSGCMLYGMSLFYGVSGSTNLYEIKKALVAGNISSAFLLLAMVLLLGGFFFKISAVPFHMWVPDVYHGAPTPITGFLSVGPKAAGFAILIRFFYLVMVKGSQTTGWSVLKGFDWTVLIGVVSAFTMTIGNLAAIGQSNAKRLLAYSSIAHAGYMLMGFVVLNPLGLKAILFYLIVYLFMNLGAFLFVIAIANVTGDEEIESYRGLAWKAPLPAVAMTVFLFSLTGIPPFSGFVGKILLFAAVIREKWYILAVIGILNSVISLYYYARIIKVMFLETPVEETPVEITRFNRWVLTGFIIPNIAIGIYWGPIVELVEKSFKFIGP